MINKEGIPSSAPEEAEDPEKDCMHPHECVHCRERYSRLETAEHYVKQLESALRSCDFWLDEFSCGACSAPPKTSPLVVPVAVRKAVTRLRHLLARAESPALEALRQRREQQDEALKAAWTALDNRDATNIEALIQHAREALKPLLPEKKVPAPPAEPKPCRACGGKGGSFEPVHSHLDNWEICSVCKGTKVAPP